MKTQKKIAVLLSVIIAIIAFIAGCKKDDSLDNGMVRMKVSMIDAPSPYNYEAINIDVQGLRAKIDGQWQDLSAKPGIHNILALVNGHNVLLADANVPKGDLTGIQLLLGGNNTIKVGGEVHALTIPSGADDGLQVLFDEPRPIEDHPITIDFDAAHSIVDNGNGTFNLVPVLHVFTSETSGSISGQVTPAASGIAIVAIGQNMGDGDQEDDNDGHGDNNNGGPWEGHHHHHHHHNGHGCGYHHDDDQLVYSAYADSETGQFLLQGLDPGTYTIKIYPANSEIAVVFYNVTVTSGGVTSLGVITLP